MLKTLSTIVGVLATITIPRIFRTFLFGSYCKFYKVNLTELPRRLNQFKNFQDFFTREIDPASRPISNAKFVSPVDGLLVEYGYFTEDKKINVKSFSYLLKEFIPDANIHQHFLDGLYIILYLSPKDYHRIHSPADAILEAYFRIAGDLRTVNPSQGEKLPKVLATNERVVSILKLNDEKKIALVKVGATNVGSITFSLAQNSIYPTSLTKADITVKKGQEIAKFNLGSTVVLCFPKNSFSNIGLKTGKHYKLGQELELNEN